MASGTLGERVGVTSELPHFWELVPFWLTLVICGVNELVGFNSVGLGNLPPTEVRLP